MSTSTIATSNTASREHDRAMIISSDGHALAVMEDYRDYLPARMHAEFDEFCELYRHAGARSNSAEALVNRLDPDVVQAWKEEVIDTNRTDGASDPNRRLEEMDADGRAAEVLFPDFGIPFELGSLIREASHGYRRSPERVTEGYRAHNRWLVDFCAVAPHRLAGMALISFDDVPAALEDIRWAHEHDLKGILLPEFDEMRPLFHPDFEPIWNLVEELGLPVNCHSGNSAITRRPPIMGMIECIPHPAVAIPLFVPQTLFFSQQILGHLIWGGVLQRHPTMKAIFTELGSGWVVGALAAMDYSYDGSYLRRDIREVVPDKPSDYFARQCYLGSSIFSRAEIAMRAEIGVDKMMLGMDYPHHEGAWAAGPGSLNYLRATLGSCDVPEDEARTMLGGTASEIFAFDRTVLAPIAERIGPRLADVLSKPDAEWYPRGDVNKPAGVVIG